MNPQLQSGQVLLIVILVMVVALTVGLSVAARSITNVRIANEEESSERAFAAAEAGLERALVSNAATTGSLSNSALFETTLSTLSGQEFLLQGGTPIPQDDGVDLWLSTYPSYSNPWSGNITIYWGVSGDVCNASATTNTMPALMVSLITGTSAFPRITYYAFEPCNARAGNNFEVIPTNGGTITGKTFLYRRTIAVSSGIVARIVPLYAPAVIGVRGCDGANNNCNALPTQGTLIQSVGTSDTTKRKIVSFRGYPKVPSELFPYNLFSPK
ncbi:MAG: hypothetical protein AAB553_03835 [Patescibacteria group bacterium]